MPVITERFPELERLSIEEKIVLISELWDDVYGEEWDQSGFDNRIVQELERRAAHHRRHSEGDLAEITLILRAKLAAARAIRASDRMLDFEELAFEKGYVLGGWRVKALHSPLVTRQSPLNAVPFPHEFC